MRGNLLVLHASQSLKTECTDCRNDMMQDDRDNTNEITGAGTEHATGWSNALSLNEADQAGATTATSQFASTLASFNLQRPRGHSHTVAQDTSHASLEGYPLYTAPRRLSSSTSGLTPPGATSSILHRQQQFQLQQQQQQLGTRPSTAGSDAQSTLGAGGPWQRTGSDSPMMVGSPPLDHHTGASYYFSSGAGGGTSSSSSSVVGGRRSRAASESMGSNTTASNMNTVPPSPIALARALQGHPRTPPPFLARRLYNEMQDESEISRSDAGNIGGSAEDELSASMKASTASGGGSGSASGEESGSGNGARTGVVRRAVSRKPNLLVSLDYHYIYTHDFWTSVYRA